MIQAPCSFAMTSTRPDQRKVGGVQTVKGTSSSSSGSICSCCGAHREDSLDSAEYTADYDASQSARWKASSASQSP